LTLSRRSLLGRAAFLAGAQILWGKSMAAGAAPQPRPRFMSDPFALGVASGDPRPGGATIWTRLVGAGLESLEAPVRVIWEVSATESFSVILQAGEAGAVEQAAHALHIDIEGLRPGRDYFYRFQAGDATSRTGRFRTLPLKADRLRLALTSCQHWEHGFFAAYADLVRQSPDLVLQVGDYIYEKSFGAGPDVRRFPSGDPVSLAAYRARHALYKTDPHLQAAHAAAAWLVSPDDHEVENDYAGAHSALSDTEVFLRRRAAAYQAYLEHMPISLTRLSPEAVRFHGKVDIGDLAALYLLDTRQYRSAQPGAPEGRAGGSIVPRDAALQDAERSMLGFEQQTWLTGNLARPQPSWTILAQQTLMAPLLLQRPEGEMIWSDIWDGYPASRGRVLEALGGGAVRHAVVLSGDVHSFWRNDLQYSGRHVADEIVTSCLASRNAPAALLSSARADNPHIKFLDNAHAGYTFAEFSRDSLQVTFRAIRDIADPYSEVFTLYAEEIERRTASGSATDKGR